MQNFSENSLSVTGKKWRFRTAETGSGYSLSQQLAMPEVVGRILVGRGLNEVSKSLEFMSPKFSNLPDPSHFLGMDKAVDRIINALNNNEKITVFGDYDVDGACASALLVRFFRSLGNEPDLYIPDRNREGYGTNNQAFDKIKENGSNLVITVDCGSMAHESMSYAKSIGLDVIVTDHHQTKPIPLECIAFINPNRVDETSPCGMLSGAGVAFYLALATRRKLREIGFFADKNEVEGKFNSNSSNFSNSSNLNPTNNKATSKLGGDSKGKVAEPKIELLLDLVAVSTICDMVPLTGVNRLLVQRGLKILESKQNQGFMALLEVAKVTEKPSTYHAGFVIGPRINAGGRVAECDLGAKLLATEDIEIARKIADRLDRLNEERKRIEEDVLNQAKILAEKEITSKNKAIVLAGKGWHEGVIGIVASRIKEIYHLPTFIVAIGDEFCKASGRSIVGIDLGKIVIDCGDLLIKGGGHKMAAGLSISEKNLDKFHQKFNELVAKQAEQGRGEEIFQPHVSLDGNLSTGAITKDFMEVIARLEPYGSGNSEPKFVFNNVKVAFAKTVGKDNRHLQFSVVTGTGKPLRGIAFKAMENGIGNTLIKAQKDGKRLAVCGALRPNFYNGQTTYQLQLADVWDGEWQGGQ